MKKFKPLPSKKYLDECFSYDRKTGVFIWKKRPQHHFKDNKTFISINKQRAGNIAGHYKPDSGYLILGIDSNSYRAHRIAWKMVTGRNPPDEIDHIDMNRKNCAISNLRSATGCENARNRKAYSNNKLGIKGVSFNKKYGKYQVEIMRDRIKYNLGYYDNKEDAKKAYDEGAIKYHKDFSRTNELQ